MKKFIISLVCILLAGVLTIGVAYGIKNADNIQPTTGSVSQDTNKDTNLSDIVELNKKIDEYAKQVTALNTYITELEEKDEDNQAIIEGLEEVINNKTAQMSVSSVTT